MSKPDYYESLGLSRGASATEIKQAYRKLAREYHPDVNKEPGAEERFKEISEAYSVLSDDQKRAVYDQYGHAGVNAQGAGGGNFEGDFFGGFGGVGGMGGIGEIFDAFFGGSTRGGGRSAGEDGRDLRTDITLDLIDTLDTVEREVSFDRQETCETCDGTGAKPGTQPATCPRCKGNGQIRQVRSTVLGQLTQVLPCDQCGGTGTIIEDPCPTCKGQKRNRNRVTLTVKVPPGIEEGLTLRYPGEGDAGRNGGHPGDLYVVLHVKPDERFEREGVTLYTDHTISFAKAALGGKLKIQGLDDEYDLDIPAGTQPDTDFKIANAGLPPIGGGQRGALHVNITVSVPKKLTDAQRTLIREFAQASGEDMATLAEPEKSILEKFKGVFKGD